MKIIVMVASAIICYLLGSISSSILVGRMFGLSDIRKHGSGNAGATNTLRVLGKKAAVFTVLGDVLKTVIAVLIARLLANSFLDPVAAQISVYISAFAIALGHNFPIYFKFKGGKGVLTSGVIIIMISPLFGTLTVLTCLTVMAITKYVSLGSITGGVLYPLLIILFETNDITKFETNDITKIVFALVLGLMLVIRHSANIKRLVKGTENKLGAKKEQK